MDVPAMAAYPWREEYFAEMASVPVRYRPYLEYQAGPFAGRYVNIEGWTRRSYRSQPAGSDVPVVEFFGGSKMWGEGQRDEHTIPSMVARYAAEAGVPIEAVNDGQRGWVNWQEMLLFEQVTAGDERPDLAVFYDGSNDVNAQLGPVQGVPTTTTEEGIARLFDDAQGNAAPSPAPSSSSSSLGDLLRQVVSRYDERSALHRLLDQDPAGASERSVGSLSSAAQDPSAIKPPTAADVPKVLAATLDVYARGRALISSVAAERGIEPVFFLERQITRQPPVGAPKADYARYLQIIDGLRAAGPDVIDVASVLDDHQDTYIDPGHTNEAGAALIAKAMFEHLEPRLRAWYRTHG
ncbi:hypothetical protein KSP35_09140 [Aquihabitans sp. G128]|uniref:hypothetical protein n=1 Tax=Aquihabitans sp. G128 TaxID=2849779 RepID=UPI001C228ED8|nr:hypothetical protein [Aquihabitans sp. G128]QXC62924.1 hypothetical protein KSP35_09140 [Aquihabitans sp. G128]